MSIDRPDGRIAGEDLLAYAAFLAFADTRDLKDAYSDFMQNNPGAQTSFKHFLGWASRHRWQARINDIDVESELATVRETRRAGIDNNLTAETVAKELFTTCMEEMQLRKGELTHRDIGKYLDIAAKINDRWVDKSKESPNVIVNVGDNSTNTVDISDKILQRLGREMAEEDE